MSDIRKDVLGKKIWILIYEITDIESWFVVNVIIGILNVVKSAKIFIIFFVF